MEMGIKEAASFIGLPVVLALAWNYWSQADHEYKNRPFQTSTLECQVVEQRSVHANLAWVLSCNDGKLLIDYRRWEIKLGEKYQVKIRDDDRWILSIERPEYRTD